MSIEIETREFSALDPSALAPGVGETFSVEKSGIYFAVEVGDPLKLTLVVEITPVRITAVRQVWIVNIFRLGEVAQLVVQSQQSARSETVVVHYKEVDK
jgi:hypothetical protein